MQCNIKVRKHQYLDVSRGISKLITYWNPVINCSTRSPGDNSSIICGRKEKFSISPVGRRRKETASQNSFIWNYCNKRVWSISSYPINFGVSTSKGCKLQTRYQKKSNLHQILNPEDNAIGFPNTYPLKIVIFIYPLVLKKKFNVQEKNKQVGLGWSAGVLTNQNRKLVTHPSCSRTERSSFPASPVE